MIPPLPLSSKADEPYYPARAPLPDMPQDTVHEALPPQAIEVPPFGEVRETPVERPKAEIPPLASPPQASPIPDEAPALTDQDLTEALLELVGERRSDARCLADPDFEALLRSTVRRAIAEHAASPFDRPDFAHRCLWRFNALLTSRSYDDIVHKKMRRFRVEELLLFDREHSALISFASVKPVRHASARKVSPFAHRIAAMMRDSSGALFLEFRLEDGRRALVRPGRLADLVAVIQGEPDILVKSDLDYALRRIEERFRHELESGEPLLSEIQPLLEECLLIHSPTPPLGG